MYLEIVTFPELFQFYLKVPYIRIYFYSYRILPIWDLYGQKSLYGAYIGPEWNECPDSAHMGPIYTCLLGKYPHSGVPKHLMDTNFAGLFFFFFFFFFSSYLFIFYLFFYFFFFFDYLCI